MNPEDGEIGRRGTRVEVRSLFGDIPVRAKQMCLRYSSQTEVHKTFDRIKSMAVGYILARQGAERLQMSLKCGDRLYFHKDTERSDSTDAYLKQVVSTLSQAKMLSDTSTSSWRSLSLVSGNWTIHAAISVKAAAAKTCQFISIRHSPIYAQEGSNWLLNAVNDSVEQSDFGVVEDDFRRRHQTHNQRRSMQSRPVKGVDRFLMFYIYIESKRDQEEDFIQDGGPLELAEQTTILTSLLKTLIYQFLDKNGFNSATSGQHGYRVMAPDTLSQSPYKKSSTQSPTPRSSNRRTRFNGIPLNDWPRIKCGHTTGFRDHGNGLTLSMSTNRDRTHAVNAEPAFESTRNLQPQAQTTSIDKSPEPETSTSLATNKDTIGPILWENPRDGRPIRLHPRTGTVLGESDGDIESYGRPGRRFVHPPKSRHTKIATLETKRPEFPEVEKCLQKYKDILGRKKQETPIATLSPHATCISSGPTDAMGTSNTRGPRDVTLTKEALAKAVVVGQVDHKFVLAKVPGSDTRCGEDRKNLLVLIDQHAADERVKYERLCQEACNNASASLSPPLVFEVDEAEADLFEERQSYFRKWRIEYVVHAGHDTAWSSAMKGPSSRYLRVSALPAVIVTRCLSDPKVVIDLLRSSIWSSHPPSGKISSGNSSEQQCSDAGAMWISIFAHCPPLMVEMIKSRSCRTAIMFNDTLTLAECTQLVSRLSRCCFPFQCAHGRPTCSVLMEITMDEQRHIDSRALGFVGDACTTGHIGFGVAWDNWTRSG